MKMIIPIYNFGKAGGARVLSQLANHWIKDGHQVIFLAHQSSDVPYYPTLAEVLYYDNKGSLSNAKMSLIRPPRTGIFLLRKVLKKILDQLDCDIILANHSLTAQPVARTKNKAKKFYYIQAYEPDFYNPLTLKNRILKQITIKSYGLGLNVIVNSEMYYNYHEITANKYVPPGLDLKVFSPRKIDNNTQIIIGTIGRKEKHKGTGYIIEAFCNLRKRGYKNVELHVAFGDLELENIEGIKVYNPDGDEKLSNFYNSLDVYVCAQTIQLDAIHYPILESMACKTSVITTGYYPANSKNAFMIPIHSVTGIEDAIVKFLNFPKNAISDMKEIAYEDIKQFDWNNVSRKMLGYFES